MALDVDKPPAVHGWRKDGIAVVVAAAAAVVIVNVAFLQNGQHPAPLFAARPSVCAGAEVDPRRRAGSDWTAASGRNPKSRRRDRSGEAEPSNACRGGAPGSKLSGPNSRPRQGPATR